jgi:penicillin V acylase-like amidase (Ntn superfamily)
MIRAVFLFLVFLLGFLCPSRSCTTFFIHHHGQMVFGRNYDWVADAGMVCTNQRGLVKTSMKNPDGEVINWTSRYGSVTFNQYGKEFPTGGMNEKGLVVELMWLDETKYPVPDKRPAIGVLQWIQYQLDLHGSVDEVIASDSVLRITSSGTPLHYLVADAKGSVATIEFLNGKMVVHRNQSLPYPVLTNDTYDRSVASQEQKTYSGNNSLERFTTACNMISAFKASDMNKSLVDQSFDILERVSQGDYTKWRIVYDITARKIWFATEQFPQRRFISFQELDFVCNAAAKTIDMNRPEGGNIGQQMQAFTSMFNQRIVEKTLAQSRSRVPVSDAQKRALLAFSSTIHCE